MLVVDAMEAALAAVEENRRVPVCRSGKQWRVLKMLSGRRRHRGSAVSAGVSSSLLLQKTGEKPIEGPTKRPSTGSIEERAAPAALGARAGARRVGGRHTEYSEKVGKRGSMPKLIAQRPAIGSWTWSRDCVYWCRLAGPKGLADGHPPTTYCYVVDGLALAKQKKMMVIEDTDPLLPPPTPRHVEPQLVSLGNFAENFCPHLCLPANSLFSPCSHGDINWREIRLFFFLALCLSGCTDRHKDDMRAYAANS